MAITPTGTTPEGRDWVMIARSTTRGDHYYAGISAGGYGYAIGRLADGRTTVLAGIAASEIVAGVEQRLRFELEESDLRLFDDDLLVLATTDTVHRPRSSYVGLQSTHGFGTAAFRDLCVTGLAPVAT
ncbi:hypothetical protein MT356_18965 [Rathayibacter festucae]|uniref:hypothetical protein n=1 Tax=Rathayibacter festucae TaxID=110937 RepID=UPI001FB36251|nr:hypothetical protein [Rathayibacter festucae]MCJ1701794.1 hypothetical protein [Rathayibacter festucae]